jgi:hypothetical protein
MSREEHKDAIEVRIIFHEGQRMFAVPKQPAPVPTSWIEMVTVNLLREGVNKHKARELAEHFYGLAPAQPAPVQQALLPAGLPTPDELDALLDGNDGMLLDAPFLYKLDLLASWMRKYTTAAQPAPVQEPE